MSNNRLRTIGNISYTICASAMVAIFAGFLLTQTRLSDIAMVSLHDQWQMLKADAHIAD